MDSTSIDNIAILGAGGKHPKVALIGTGATKVRKIMDLPENHSAYAIAIKNDSVVIATKGGAIYIIKSVNGSESRAPLSTQKFTHGVPILSICWVSSSIIAASDVTGNCFLLDINKEEILNTLPVESGEVCSLLEISDGLLAGLTNEGNLLFWKVYERRLIQHIVGPPPPPIGAFVRMVYWTPQNSLAYPALDGQVVLLNLTENETRNYIAHKGHFYSIAVWNQKLLTAGKDDGRLKIWAANSDRPSVDLQCPKDIIDMCIWGESLEKILFANENGTVSLYSIEDEHLQLQMELEGRDYRAITKMEPHNIQPDIVEDQKDDLDMIVQEIQDGFNHLSGQINESLYSRLVEMGYPHVSLALQSQHEEKKGNIIEALHLCSSLVEILPQDNPNTCASMERYISLLERVWCFTEADIICKKIKKINADYPFKVDVNRIARIAEIQREKNCVIESESPIESIIQSAGIMNKMFEGRIVIHRHKEETCEKVQISTNDIIEKFHQVSKETNLFGLPEPQIEQIWWLGEEDSEQIEAITFNVESPENDIKGLQLAIKVANIGMNTIVVPAVLFSKKGSWSDKEIEEENMKTLKMIMRIKTKPESQMYLKEIHKVVLHSLRRLITSHRSPIGI